MESTNINQGGFAFCRASRRWALQEMVQRNGNLYQCFLSAAGADKQRWASGR